MRGAGSLRSAAPTIPRPREPPRPAPDPGHAGPDARATHFSSCIGVLAGCDGLPRRRNESLRPVQRISPVSLFPRRPSVGIGDVKRKFRKSVDGTPIHGIRGARSAPQWTLPAAWTRENSTVSRYPFGIPEGVLSDPQGAERPCLCYILYCTLLTPSKRLQQNGFSVSPSLHKPVPNLLTRPCGV